VSGFRSAAGTIGLIGAIFMIVSVFFLLNSIENTFNSIMDADKKRSVLHKLSAYTFVLVWSPLLFGLAYIVRTDAGINFTVIEKLGIFYHYVLIVGTFTLGYKIIPNKTIATRHAFVGGVFATLLWQVANKSFTHFVSEMVQYDRIYGTLGVIPLFLVWLYMVWVVVLAGMEITYVTRHWERLNAGLRPLREPDAWAIQVLERIGRRYLEGDRFEDDKTLLKHLKLTPLELKNILDVLIDKKIVVPFNEEGPYTLARHPDRIMLWEVVSFFVPSFRALARNGNAAVEYTPLGAKLRSDLAGMTLNGWLAAHSEKKR
jgi:membrane protein